MNNHIDTASTEAALLSLARDPDVRVLRRASSLADFTLAPGAIEPIRRVAIVDTETTSLDPANGEIIDLAVVMVDVNARGEIVALGRGSQALRDPGCPIPPPISKLTGITDADVAGKGIDVDRLVSFLDEAEVLIAHNARFDAAFLEAFAPGIKGRPWACSAKDFDWADHGFDGCKLGHLLMQIGRWNDGHRAMADVISLIHLLAHRLGDGRTIMSHVLENAVRTTFRVEAPGAPFEKRGLLKARGYAWDPKGHVWWIEVVEAGVDDERRWLRQDIGTLAPPRVAPVTWYERHR